jgi:hypothetical protein
MGATGCVPVAPAQRRRVVVIQLAEAKVTPSAVRWTAVDAHNGVEGDGPAGVVEAVEQSSRCPPRMNSNASAAPAPNQSHRRPERLEDLRNHPVSEPQTHLPARDVAITAITRGSPSGTRTGAGDF